MARISDPGFLPKLIELLQIKDPLNLPLQLDASQVGLTIAVPAELLLERAKPAAVQIVPGSSGDYAYYSTRVRLSAPAVAARFSWAAVAVAPHSTAPRIRELQLVAVRANHAQGIKTAFISLGGHFGAAPAAPNGSMKRLFAQSVSQVVADSADTARTSQVGDAAADDAVGNFVDAERLLEWRTALVGTADWFWPGAAGGGAESGEAIGSPLVSRIVVRPQPHLCGFVVVLVGATANTILGADFQLIVRESY